MSVPACPIPIHQTKLMIAKPHATGIVMPQIPVPTAKRYAIPYSNNIIRANAPTKPKTHHLGGRRFRTIKADLVGYRSIIVPRAENPHRRPASTNLSVGLSDIVKPPPSRSPDSDCAAARGYVVRGPRIQSSSSL